ncbi:MAG: LysM peptidoglycan-binding domain-containing protein [Myxococcales bacterium]
MSYTVRRGDTLNTLAQRFGTSVSALVQANGIRNKHLIVVGQKLRIPGRRDDFVPAAPRANTPARRPASPAPSRPPVANASRTQAPAARPSGGGGARAFELAKGVLGRHASELKRSGGAIGKAMQDWVPNNVNCANFVSAVLRVAGQIPASQHDVRVMGLMAKLDRNPNFQRVTLRNAKPGDVVSMKTPGGQHVVLFAGWRDGRPLYIGSNNVNRDGTQRISYSHFNYPIMAVHQYRR